MRALRKGGRAASWLFFTAAAIVAAIAVDALARPEPAVGFALAGILGVTAALAAMRAA